MSTNIGRDGTVKFGSTTVAELRGWTLNRNADTVDDTVMRDTWKTSKTTLKSWQVSGDLFWDPTDAGQISLSIGTTATFNLYPTSIASGSTYFTGVGLFTSHDAQTRHDGMIEASFSAVGVGSLTVTTV